MVDIRELVNYNAQIRHRYFEAFTMLPWEEFTKNREASFYSLRDIFLHTLNAVDYWLSFLQKEPYRLSPEFNDESFEAIQRCMEHVETRMNTYLETLPPEKLKETYAATDDDGKPVEVTAEDVLFHVFEEEVQLRGEFIVLLWQMGQVWNISASGRVKEPTANWRQS